MQELLELRINYKYANLLFKESDGVNLGDPILGYSIKVVKIDTSSPIVEKIDSVTKQVYEQYGECFYFGWAYKRIYTSREMREAKLFNIIVRQQVEFGGEEYGTIYDQGPACDLCGSGYKQLSPLRLKKGFSLRKRDAVITLANEIIVSKRFVEVMKANDITGMTFGPIEIKDSISEDCYQLMMEGYSIDIAEKTRFGDEPFDFAENKREIFPCPNGDLQGLNILSEAYVKNSSEIYNHDFLISKQTYGMPNTGGKGSPLLRPRPLLFCSSKWYQVVQQNKLKGFSFEIAHIVNNGDIRV